MQSGGIRVYIRKSIFSSNAYESYIMTHKTSIYDYEYLTNGYANHGNLPIIQHIRIKWAIILIKPWYRSNDILLLDQLPLILILWSQTGVLAKQIKNHELHSEAEINWQFRCYIGGQRVSEIILRKVPFLKLRISVNRG